MRPHKRRRLLPKVAISYGIALVQVTSVAAQQPLRVASPDGKNEVIVAVTEGTLRYSVRRDGRALIFPSRLGFEFRGVAPLRDSVRIVDTSRKTFDTSWTQPWGEVSRVRERYNELRLTAAETTPLGRRFVVAFRVFDDGVGFRYELPEQPNLRDFEVMDELTEFAMADDARAWWIPSNRPRMDRSEMLYSSSPISVIDSVQTPLTMETRDGRTAVVIHEANLVDYARMNLAGSRMEQRTLRVALA
ncbi:MAG: glycoside hydrolase family 97 N-terminal domain-containing protein, partial [Gemmatimonadaceae bacterium]